MSMKHRHVSIVLLTFWRIEEQIISDMPAARKGFFKAARMFRYHFPQNNPEVLAACVCLSPANA